jgi:hypothetical protein
MMLDNSSSMDIAATPGAMATLTSATPCDASNAFYVTGGTPAQPKYTNQSLDSYDNYQCGVGANAYDANFAPGLPACPATAPTQLATFNPGAYPNGAFPAGPYPTDKDTPPKTNETCNPILQPTTASIGPNKTPFNFTPLAGPPCAFACHWTTNMSADGKTTADLFGLARRQGIQLRFDVVKQATIDVLNTMQADNLSALNNLSVGIYAFNSTVTEVYPNPTTCGAKGSPACEAGRDFAEAQTLVGAPPPAGSVTDTGLMPSLAKRLGDNDDTAFPEDMNTLYNTYVTPAGAGATATAPRKVLFLVTDGFEDDPNIAGPGARAAFESSYCNQFKSAGYRIYVVYTPYYPVEHYAYFANDWARYVEQTGPQSISYQLQACSSQGIDDQTYYISAADGPSLTAALEKFLKQALDAPARFTE